MNELSVQIVELEPMRVAHALGFGAGPEEDAWAMIAAWMRANGLLEDAAAIRFFGFNNPSPTPGSPNYGYEQWITVDADAHPAEPVGIKDFEGGLYAVARCDGLQHIGEIWKELVVWCQASHYQMADRPCLEECLTPELFLTPPAERELAGEALLQAARFDLYLAIAK